MPGTHVDGCEKRTNCSSQAQIPSSHSEMQMCQVLYRCMRLPVPGFTPPMALFLPPDRSPFTQVGICCLNHLATQQAAYARPTCAMWPFGRKREGQGREGVFMPAKQSGQGIWGRDSTR